MQLDAIRRVRPIHSCMVYSRKAANADSFARASVYDSFKVHAAKSVAAAVNGADLIVTTTPSKEALLRASDVSSNPAATIIAVGADTPGKQEVSVDLLEMIRSKGGKLVADKRQQAFVLGDLQHVSQETQGTVTEMGDSLTGRATCREGNEMIFVDLTGVGAQDAAIAEAAFKAVLAARSLTAASRL
jgi:ornithine cyclodeaminase